MGRLIDGEINPARYWSSSTRIVHLLKQGVSKRCQAGMSLGDQVWQDFGDDPDWIDVKWKVCAFRTICILGGLPPWRVVRGQDAKAVLSPAFLRTAVVNVVQTTGESTTARRALWKLARRDWRVVRRQLRRLDPDIVVCGGTFDVVADLWPFRSEGERRQALQRRYWRDRKTIFVSARHPRLRGVRFADDYATFRVTLQRARSNPDNAQWWSKLMRTSRQLLLG